MIDDGPLIDMLGNPVDESKLFDPGRDPSRNELRWRPLRDRFGEDFKAAYEEACCLSDELARLYNLEPVIARPYESRMGRLDGVIARAEERLAKLRGQRAALEEGLAAALKPNRESRQWRLERLHEFRRDYNASLRLKAQARSLRLTGGKFTFTHHGPKVKLVEQIGQDGNALSGKTDEAALMEGLSVLRRCGLHEVYEPLVVTTAKVALNAVKQLLTLENGRAVIKCHVNGKHEGLADRVAAEGGEAWPTVNRETGEVLGYDVTLPAVQVIRDPNSGEVIMSRDLIREAPPEEEWTLGFKPAEPGQVSTDEEEETDADE